MSQVLLPPDDDAVVEERLPGWNYPSDHVALIADLRVPFSALISHQLEPDAGKIRGALSIVAILGCMVLGPCLPVAAFIALWHGHATLATMLATFVAITLTTGAHSPKLCAAYLKAAGWFPEVWLHVTRDALAAMRGPASTLWCMHPHGTSIGFGFSLNGAVRFKTGDDMRYAPRELVEGVPSERRATCDGVMAPVLFRIPLLRQILLGFGCATPATKRRMCDLMNRGIDFGILPGGMHEVALYEKGRDRIYTRPGFVKYALQYGVCLLPAFTFGESDLYTNLRAPLYRRVCEFTLMRFGFIIPVFWGPRWWCPLLPRDDVALHTVVAGPCDAGIENPTRSDVEQWHCAYVAALTASTIRTRRSLGTTTASETVTVVFVGSRPQQHVCRGPEHREAKGREAPHVVVAVAAPPAPPAHVLLDRLEGEERQDEEVDAAHGHELRRRRQIDII